MDLVLTNALPMSVSTFMKEDMVYISKLSVSMVEDLLAMDPHDYEMEDYINWNAKVDGWCDNLKTLIAELQHLQVIVAKKRINTPESQLHIDG